MLEHVVNCLGETSVKNIYESILLLKIHCCFNIAAEVQARIFYANWTVFPKCVHTSYSTCLSGVGWVEHQNNMRITPSQLRPLQNRCIFAASADDLLKMFASTLCSRRRKICKPVKSINAASQLLCGFLANCGQAQAFRAKIICPAGQFAECCRVVAFI